MLYTDTGLRVGDLKLLKGRPRVTASFNRALLPGEAEELKRRGLEIIEFRADQVKNVDDRSTWPKLVEMAKSFRPFPIILTIRIDHEGGGWKGWDREYSLERLHLRRRLYEKLAEHVDAFDVEFLWGDMSHVIWLGRKVHKPVIISAHYFRKLGEHAETMPNIEHLVSLAKSAKDNGATIVKQAVMLKRQEEEEILRQVLLDHPELNLIVIPMGDLGRQGRLTFGHDGSLITFVALTPESASAPGQWLLDDFVAAMQVEYPEAA